VTEVEFLDPVIGRPDDDRGHFRSGAAYARFAAAYRAAAAGLPPWTPEVAPTRFGRVRAYRFEGPPERVPLVLLSGRNASSPTWAPAIPALVTDRPVIALDSVGEAGCSGQTAPLAGGADQAEWVADAVEALGVGPVHLVGHSLGGWTAAQVAMRRPDVLRSVVVLDPPATFAPLRAGFVAAGMAAALVPMPRPVRRRLLGWIAGGAEETTDASTAAVMGELGLAALEGYRVRQPPPARPSSEELAAIPVPMLAVLAGRSRVHDGAAAAAAARSVDGCVVDLWPDAAHTLHVDDPERLAAAIRGFTAPCEGAPRHDPT
jgi:pimeloyl-ACP methyl ester carboxylesterase